MATCEICGNEFDDRGVQMVVPGLAKSFDSIDCAVRARSLAGASGAALPMRAMLVPLAANPAASSFALGGLSAGLAAALGGTRARVALGGATVGVALLSATTAHLATRGGETAAEATRPQALAPPAREAGDFARRARVSGNPVSGVTGTAAQPRSAPEVRYALPAAGRSSNEPRVARVVTVATRARTHRPTAVRQAPSPKPSSSSSATGSTRRGWGHGDKNHSHTGPGKHSQAAKQGTGQKHK
jgi:hypothetical protein